jgi:phosphoribosylformylglycinamidine synthase I
MMRPKVKILYAPGTNCHHEAADAFRLAGAESSICNFTDDILSGKEKLTDCDLLAIPGGFAFGDHVAAGRILAIDLIYRLKDQLFEIEEKGIPIIGICNGFQVLINTGILPGNGERIGQPDAVLDRNLSAVYESRWVTLYVQKAKCIWTNGLTGLSLRMPVAHGEGRLLLPDYFNDQRTVFRYGAPNGTQSYPDNPNASPGGRAGICNSSGRILGLMPHPERAIYSWLGSEDGLKIFQAGVASVR